MYEDGNFQMYFASHFAIERVIALQMLTAGVSSSSPPPSSPVVQSHIYKRARTHVRARTGVYACSSSFYPPGHIFMRITHAASCISAPTGACAAHFKRKIFSRLLINGLTSTGSLYARTISDPETL